MRLQLRIVTPADGTFLYNLHKEAIRPSVEATWGPWDDVWQQDRPVMLHVLKANEAGKRLYERLGFVVTAVEELKYKMLHAVP